MTQFKHKQKANPNIKLTVYETQVNVLELALRTAWI